jgi:hypothetical protein
MAEVTAQHCADLSESPTAYNESLDGEGTVTDVRSAKTGTPEEVPAGGAWEVNGSATVELGEGDGGDSYVSWRCFVQRADGKVYADIVKWTVTG